MSFKHQFRLLLTLFILGVFWLPASAQSKPTLAELRTKIEKELGKYPFTYAVAFKDLSTGQELLMNEREVFHAASTMKTPVMIEVYKQQVQGKLSLKDSILIKTDFKSIVDGSPYSLKASGDSDTLTYKQIGRQRTLADLVFDMITMSSNLATNLIIELVGGPNVTQTMRELGARDIQVRRGVEDSKAFAQGLNNTTTAYDLMVIFEKIANGQAVSPEASQAMIGTLFAQKLNSVIPAKLPKDVKVAHKTGSITGVQHDSGIVFLPDGRKYVLVLMSKNVKDDEAIDGILATISQWVYEYVAAR
ncbi:serine hydrolase [Spirosoma sp. BT702]|uniref:beta-lactamase n=1 Tax=Spirosoma profusum TaxID=2771354 RepID=A0A926Y228_9BACT|nr:serine hydrolase [Spirosoma profusum]MBD2702198.1 serine hydrolase [Spirosoma profusum]